MERHDKKHGVERKNMDLLQILKGIEGAEELKKTIDGEIGKDFVPRSEFNEKNEKLKSAQEKLESMTVQFDALSKEKGGLESQIAELHEKVSGYEMASMKAKIAHEEGIPFELASRLTGSDEESIRKDAKLLSGLVSSKEAAPLKSTEPHLSSGDEALRGMLKTLNEN